MMAGKIEWIGVRPERRAEVVAVDRAEIDLENGIEGDHVTQPHRQVTIISKEQMEQVAARLGKDNVDPSATRRNILISGLDFDLNSGTKIALGDAEIEVTGYCHPCSRMDENLGDGGRLAMARLAGYTCKVLKGGTVTVGADVAVLDQVDA